MCRTLRTLPVRGHRPHGEGMTSYHRARPSIRIRAAILGAALLLAALTGCGDSLEPGPDAGAELGDAGTIATCTSPTACGQVEAPGLAVCPGAAVNDCLRQCLHGTPTGGYCPVAP